MRLSVRRFQPDAVVATFLGLLDIKLGCEIIILFALINKVAGVYGLIMLVLGVGTLSQFLFYAYSVITLIVFAWALRAIKSETAYRVLLAAHIYLADHLIQTLFHYIFYYRYWYEVKHDGKRELNSQAQKDIFNLALSRNETEPLGAHSDAAAALANRVWAEEKGYAVGVTLIGFLLKVYFIVVLYSYAAHLRNSSYHSLPLTSRAHRAREARSGGGPQVASQADDIDLDLHDVDEHVDAAAAPSASSSSSAPRAGNGGPGTKAAAGKGKGDDHDDFSWD
ncbi:Inositol phoshorylceramide synthase regulatory subunit kei1 [Vanrija pseudolonga]|uniref:Inositol phoshorylceramide synthase regulatory subunit kei1 n=1 Tax=Vanrija pseudolonga TaxID=143232 RepID=A0AAF0YF64_9TREE|nr:Inositol phoshorylceramide synthase regulatory subunit kei1 [Vanrija pseudolonga]